MSAKLVSISTCVLDEKLSPEEYIVYCARVSNPENQLNKKTVSRLIKYLIKHSHWSPFEMVDMTFEIKTSRFVSHQLIRHRSFSFQEFSQRYSKAVQNEDIQLRKQSSNNRQSSSVEIKNPRLEAKIKKLMEDSKECYDDLIDNDVAKEVARSVLPLCTKTTLYMKGSVRSWIHYLRLRTSEDTQLEHREIALNIKKIFKQHFPNIEV